MLMDKAYISWHGPGGVEVALGQSVVEARQENDSHDGVLV